METNTQQKNETAVIFDEIVQTRRSIRIYDKNAPFDPAAVDRSINRMILAPNSSNLQLWEFYRVQSPEKLKELRTYCLDQPAAATANELLVVVTRKDKYMEHCKANAAFIEKQEVKRSVLKGASTLDYYLKILPMLYGNKIPGFVKKIKVNLEGMKKPSFREVGNTDVRVSVHKSAALAAQTFMLSMKAEGYDTCPMEGFDSVRVKKFLQLPEQAQINMIIGMGTGLPEGQYGSRFRVPKEDVVFTL